MFLPEIWERVGSPLRRTFSDDEIKQMVATAYGLGDRPDQLDLVVLSCTRGREGHKALPAYTFDAEIDESYGFRGEGEDEESARKHLCQRVVDDLRRTLHTRLALGGSAPPLSNLGPGAVPQSPEIIALHTPVGYGSTYLTHEDAVRVAIYRRAQDHVPVEADQETSHALCLRATAEADRAEIERLRAALKQGINAHNAAEQWASREDRTEAHNMATGYMRQALAGEATPSDWVAMIGPDPDQEVDEEDRHG